jgi:hypothetical protein
MSAMELERVLMAVTVGIGAVLAASATLGAWYLRRHSVRLRRELVAELQAAERRLDIVGEAIDTMALEIERGRAAAPRDGGTAGREREERPEP